MASRSIPWLRVLAEGVVIVASILLAFGIDAAWDQNQEREVEETALLRLQADFMSFRSEMENNLRNYEDGLPRSRYLMALGDGRGDLVLAQADSAFRWMVVSYSFDAGQRTLESLSNSGTLRLIRNEDLHASLSLWDQRALEVLDNQLVIRDLVRSEVVPHLARSGVPLMRIYHAVYPDRPEDFTPDEEVRAAYSDLVRQSEFRSLLAFHYNWALQTRDEVLATLELIDAILTSIDSDLSS